MIDEIDYFPKRDKYKKNKGGDITEEWNALKKVKTGREVAKDKSAKKSKTEKTSENK